MPKKSRWLLQALILSVMLNVALMGIFFYFVVRDNPLHFSYKPKKEEIFATPPCSAQFLSRLQALNFMQLAELLQDDREIKDGFLVRDFALGALVSFHHVDIERCLERGNVEEKRWIHDDTTFLLFPRMSQSDFKKIKNFIDVEKWPLTTEGLFSEIEKTAIHDCDRTLLIQFCNSPEFILFQTLFARKKVPITKGDLLSLALEGGWQRLKQFYEDQEKSLDLSEKKCRELLLDYLEKDSKISAYLLVLLEEEYIFNHLDEEKMRRIEDLLPADNPKVANFLKKRITFKKQALKEKKSIPIHDEKEVAGHFVQRPVEKKLKPVFRDKPPASPPPKIHVILPGESLWIIAKKHHVSIEKLMQVNSLKSTVIHPGKTLKIP